MSDVCGGSSNPLKAFAGHVDQDRSAHQDRAGPASQPNAAQFRSTGAQVADAHEAMWHAAFAHGGLPMDMRIPEMPAVRARARPPTGALMTGPPVPATQGTPDWAVQFQQMNLCGNTAGPSTFHADVGGPVASVPADLASKATVAGPPVDLRRPVHSVATFPGNLAGAHAPPDADFEAEMDQWMAVHGPAAEAETQFRSEMDTWMSAHGPAAEAAIDREMEELARELEQQAPKDLAVRYPDGRSSEEAATKSEKHAENPDELSAAARRIVDVMDSTHATAKIKNSSFLGLMRKIAEGDVVLKDDTFVDQKGAKVDVHASAVQDGKVEPSLAALPSPRWEPVDLTGSASRLGKD